MSEVKDVEPYGTLICDIETSCFLRKGQVMRCLQLAWQLHKTDGTLLEKDSVYIKPDKWAVTPEAAEFHKITTEMATEKGIPIKEALDRFVKHLTRAEVWVGHSCNSIDIPVLTMELRACGFRKEADYIQTKMHIFCTMRSTVNICRLLSSRGYPGFKWPSLTELYEFLFKEKLEKAHDAAADTAATAKCYFKLQELAHKSTVLAVAD